MIIIRSLCIVFAICVFLSCEKPTSPIIEQSDIKLEVSLSANYDTEKIEEELDAFFNSALRNNKIIGAGVSVIIGSDVIYQKPFGYRNYSKKLLLDEGSVFRIGSLSKSFTGALCGVLHQKGLIDYHETIKSCNPELQLVNDAFSSELELVHLLSHTGGFPYHSYTNLVEDGLKMKKIVPYFSKIQSLEKPGSIYSYQNAAFAMAGLHLERKLGKNISRLYKDYLFSPLSMSQTSSSLAAMKSARNIAFPHSTSNGTWSTSRLNKKYYNAVPAGGINSSTADMSQFLKLMLGKYPTLLSQKEIDKIIEPYIDTRVSYRYYKKWPDFDESFYGMGWRIHTFKNEVSSDTLYHHGGQVKGYRSEIAFNKHEEIGISVLFNSSTSIAKNIIPTILSIIRKHKKSSQPEEVSS